MYSVTLSLTIHFLLTVILGWVLIAACLCVGTTVFFGRGRIEAAVSALMNGDDPATHVVRPDDEGEREKENGRGAQIVES